MPIWEIIGWAGSVLVVVSLMVPSVRRFRILNLTGSLIATIYNLYFGIWPYAAMNGAIVLINIYWLWRLSRVASEKRDYTVVRVSEDEAMVERFIDRNADAIAKAFPSFKRDNLQGAQTAFIMHNEEIIGLFGVSVNDGVGRVQIDFVTERFRDFTPGNFLYNHSALFDDMGLTKLEIDKAGMTDPVYFAKQGFADEGELLVRSL